MEAPIPTEMIRNGEVAGRGSAQVGAGRRGPKVLTRATRSRPKSVNPGGKSVKLRPNVSGGRSKSVKLAGKASSWRGKRQAGGESVKRSGKVSGRRSKSVSLASESV